MYHVEIMSVEQKVSIIIGVYDEMVWEESLNPILLIWTKIFTCGNHVCINIKMYNKSSVGITSVWRKPLHKNNLVGKNSA